jgi:hypothetical protein
MLSGGCHCGAVRYQMSSDIAHHSLCHCTDCRKASGAPAVAWAMVATDQIAITGETRMYESSDHGRRYFCGQCGTGLFYTSEVVFPGMTDVQSATLDDPDALPLQMQIQTAERIGWMAGAHRLPSFERYPAPPEG